MAGPRFLTLVRHAKSSWDDPGLIDFLRPLSPRGERDAPRMGAGLLDLGCQPDLVLTSPATRARQTLALLRTTLPCPTPRPRRDLYLADPPEWFAVLRAVPDTFHDVLCVGHNPGLHAFLEQLGGRAFDKVPTGAVARLRVKGSWSELAPGRALLLHFATPKSWKDARP